MKQILKKTFLYKIYLNIKYPEINIRIKKQVKFISMLIPENSLCFDVGANIGSIVDLLLKNKAKVIALEPDEGNFKILQEKFYKNKNVQLINKAADFESSQKKFYIIENDSAFNTLSEKWKDALSDSSFNRWNKERKSTKHVIVSTTTLDILIKEFGIPYYIKIDVEGFELNVIQGLSNKINLISLEVNLPEFLEETIKCIKLISNIDDKYQFNISTDDSASLNFDNWISQDDIVSFLSNTELKYLELYCKICDQ